MHGHTQHKSKAVAKNLLVSSQWLILLGFLLISASSILLWRHFHDLRPYIAGGGAALAAFLPSVYVFLTPETRGKWILSVGLACLLGLGVWYSSYLLEEEKDSLARAKQQLSARLHMQRQTFAASHSNLPTAERSQYIIITAKAFKDLYAQHQFENVLDLSGVLAAAEPENGHALYYQGEAQRSLHLRTDMRGSFQKYLQGAEHDPDSLVGDAHECYLHPAGYCGERTAWINHLMANDYYEEAQTVPANVRLDSLNTALNYEKHVLEIRPHGFYTLEAVRSSCELMQQFAARLRELGQSTTDIDSAIQRYRAHYGSC